MERPRVIVGSKLDSALPERREELRAAAAERGLQHLEISAATGEGIDRLITTLASMLAGTPREAPVPGGGEAGG